jgi:hypothetical protein
MSDTGTTSSRSSGSDQGVTETVKEQATELREKGTSEIESQLDERTTQVGQQAVSLAGALRRSGSEMQDTNGGAAGIERITSGIADRLESIGTYLERANGDEMLRDAERFARERPWVVAGSAALVGLAASRLLKASSESRYDRTMSTSSRQPAAVGSGTAR